MAQMLTGAPVAQAVFDEACNEVAGAITPRVGGLGPTTVAMLFENGVEAAERAVGTAG